MSRLRCHDGEVSFVDELTPLLPADLPERENVIALTARHLELIVEMNAVMNLTRIVEPREAAIKHVLDSVMPWRMFAAARHVADAGTGPGFPGIPLAITLPRVRFTLLDATQKKARFVESVVSQLGLKNVEVVPQRAEEWLHKQSPEIVTGRAVAPLHKAIAFFSPGLKNGARVLLYKGPDAEAEIEEARPEAKRRHVQFRVISRYELPDGLGERTLVEMRRAT